MLVFRIARAFSKRPNEVIGWDFYEEFLPAAQSLGEIPIIDELIKTLVEGLTRKTKSSYKVPQNFRPLGSKEERLKAFEDLKMKEAEARNG